MARSVRWDTCASAAPRHTYADKSDPAQLRHVGRERLHARVRELHTARQVQVPDARAVLCKVHNRAVREAASAWPRRGVPGDVGEMQVLQVPPQRRDRIHTLVSEPRALGEREIAEPGRLRHDAAHRLVGDVRAPRQVEDAQRLAQRKQRRRTAERVCAARELELGAQRRSRKRAVGESAAVRKLQLTQDRRAQPRLAHGRVVDERAAHKVRLKQDRTGAQERAQCAAVDELAAAQLDTPQRRARVRERQHAVRPDLAAPAQVRALEARARRSQHLERRVRELHYAAQVDGYELRCVAQHPRERRVGHLRAPGEREPLEPVARGHAPKQLVVEVACERRKVEPAHVRGIGERGIRLDHDVDQLEERTQLVERRAVPQNLHATHTPALAYQQACLEVRLRTQQVPEDVQENLVRQVRVRVCRAARRRRPAQL